MPEQKRRLRNIRINLNDVTEYVEGDTNTITEYFHVMTKKTNNEIGNIVNKVLDNFHEGKTSLWQLRNNITDQLLENVSKSSYKVIDFVIDFGTEE